MRNSFHSLIIIVMAILSTSGMGASNSTTTTMNTVTIEETSDVIAYYPHFARIDLVCGTMPSKDEGNVVLCCEAAFTSRLLEEFAHTNIDGDHVSGGQRYTGAVCRDNSGAFTWAQGKWQFVMGDYSTALDSAVAGSGMGFGQAVVVRNGKAIEPLWRSGVHEYRALCEKNGRLCIVDSRGMVEYAEFVRRLVAYGVTHALYLDMGSGWNHSWWRDDQGITHDIHPRIAKSRFCTNWITFYR